MWCIFIQWSCIIIPVWGKTKLDIEFLVRLLENLFEVFFKCSKNMCKIHKARIRSSHQTYFLKVLKWRQCWIESWWRPLLHDGTRIWSSSVLLKHINNQDKISLSIINWYNVFRFGPHIYVCTYTVNVYLNLACMFFWRKMIFQHVGVDLI